MTDPRDMLSDLVGVFEGVTVRQGTLTLVFHCGYSFDHVAEPVRVVTLRDHGMPNDSIAQLEAFAGEDVDGLDVARLPGSRHRIAINFAWANEGRPFVVEGSVVSVTSRSFGVEEYQSYLHRLDADYQRERVAHGHLRSKLRALSEELNERHRRATKKRDFFRNINSEKHLRYLAESAVIEELADRIRQLVSGEGEDDVGAVEG